MIGELLALLIRYAVPIAGVLIVLILIGSPSTKPGTSTKPEGDDLHRKGENKNAQDRS
jgi:hypothetical protein